jgi:hypothetical protein
MVPCERDEVGVDEYDVLEVVDDGFAVQEVVCDDEEVPSRQSQNKRCLTNQLSVLLHRSPLSWAAASSLRYAGDLGTHDLANRRGRSPPCKQGLDKASREGSCMGALDTGELP